LLLPLSDDDTRHTFTRSACPPDGLVYRVPFKRDPFLRKTPAKTRGARGAGGITFLWIFAESCLGGAESFKTFSKVYILEAYKGTVPGRRQLKFARKTIFINHVPSSHSLPPRVETLASRYFKKRTSGYRTCYKYRRRLEFARKPISENTCPPLVLSLRLTPSQELSSIRNRRNTTDNVDNRTRSPFPCASPRALTRRLAVNGVSAVGASLRAANRG